MFLNCLHPEWYNYVTNVRLAKNVKDEQYDVLFDHLQEYERLVIASRAKKVAKTHDPLALVAHTSSSSSRSTPPYYVTHPPFVVDYDDDYQGDTFSNDQEDSLTFAMMLLARAITQPVVQADRVNIQSRNVGNDGRTARRSYNTQEESAESSNVQKETGNVQRTLRTYSLGNATNVQCYNCSAKGHYERNFPKPRVRDSKYFMEQMLLAKKDKAKVILSNKQNDFLLADAAQMEEIEELSVNICMIAIIQQATTDFDEEPSYDSAFISEVHTPSTSFINPLFSNKINYGNIEHDKNAHDQHDRELELLARNAYKEAEKQLKLAKKVKQQNVMLTKQLKQYKEWVRDFESTKANKTNFHKE
ncbi:hypothetical protein Tco_0033435 [Tanacetum coccineum]